MVIPAPHAYEMAIRYGVDGLIVAMGITLLVVALKMWDTHPVNRAFFLGPYLTEKGMRFLLDHWMTVMAFGLAMIASGLNRILLKLYFLGYVGPELPTAISVVETMFIGWSAYQIAKVAWTLLWHRRK